MLFFQCLTFLIQTAAHYYYTAQHLFFLWLPLNLSLKSRLSIMTHPSSLTHHMQHYSRTFITVCPPLHINTQTQQTIASSYLSQSSISLFVIRLFTLIYTQLIILNVILAIIPLHYLLQVIQHQTSRSNNPYNLLSYKIKFTSDQEPTDNLYVNKRAKRSKVMRLWDKSGFSEVMPAVDRVVDPTSSAAYNGLLPAIVLLLA